MNTPLAELPQKLASVQGVTEALQLLESCHFCVENNDARFSPLHTARKGIFMDSKGKLFSCCEMIVCS